jgi:hypothetical protein
MKQPYGHKLTPLNIARGSRVSLSATQIVKLGVAALIGTGVFAAIERGYGRTDMPAVSVTLRANSEPDASTGPKTHRAPAAERERVSKAESRPLAEPARDPSATPPAASGESTGDGASATPGRDRDWSSGVVQPGDPATQEIATEFQTTTSATPASLHGPIASASGDEGQTAPGDCQLSDLRAVLSDVSARFGGVTMVAAHQFNTRNHISGSTREKLHHDCKAIDFRPDHPSRLQEIKTYLRSRPEITGVESYRDGVIHMDSAGIPVASRRQPSNSGRPQPLKPAPGALPPTREAPSAFVLLDRDR